MKISYCCPHWGSEQLPVDMFFKRLTAAGYTGVEIFLGDHNRDMHAAFMKALENVRKTNPGFRFIAQLICPGKPITPEEYIRQSVDLMHKLLPLHPDCINSQTGRDYFTFEDNCRIIDAVQQVAEKNSVTLLHETHRGCFSFHAPLLVQYLQQYPSLQLTGDFSHFCAVSESLLEGQEHLLDYIVPHVQHIHARVGHEQGAQVNDPFAPEWELHLARHIGWWQLVLQQAAAHQREKLTITTEFGPWPYMPSLPYSRQPVSSQWDINVRMKDYLEQYIYNTNGYE